MNHKQYAAKVTKLFFSFSDRKKLSQFVFKRAIQMAHLSGQAEALYEIFCREKNSPAPDKDLLMGDIHEQFVTISEGLAEFYKTKGMRPTTIEEVMRFIYESKD